MIASHWYVFLLGGLGLIALCLLTQISQARRFLRHTHASQSGLGSRTGDGVVFNSVLVTLALSMFLGIGGGVLLLLGLIGAVIQAIR